MIQELRSFHDNFSSNFSTIQEKENEANDI